MAAALRCLARGIGFTAKESLGAATRKTLLGVQTQVKRYHNPAMPQITEIDLSKLPDFEVSKDPAEWYYVEQLLREGKVIPEPKSFDGPSPSGWVSPKEEAKLLPYFIPRTKNHMQPVYLHLSHRQTRQITIIRRVQGDIWKLEEELKEYLESKLKAKYFKHIPSRVNEMSCQIRFRGDYVSLVKHWMDMKGF